MMGCLNAKERITYEEARILGMESLLEYYKNSSVLTDSIHRKYSTDGLINPGQWADIVSMLNIQTKNSSSCSQIENFFSLFCEGENYPMKKLNILGILLGHGHPRQKARLLFELYDDKGSELLSLAEIQQLFEEIFDICCVKLVKLADFNDSKYEELLKIGFESKKNQLFEKILKGNSSVDLKNFVIDFEFQLGKILHPHGFRIFCHK